MKLLLHVCCAPCACALLPHFAKSYQVLGYFYNPNIHPLLEFRKRLKAVKLLQEQEHFEARFEEDYGLMLFLNKVDYRSEKRCCDCYFLRLAASAKKARELKCDAFTTTLLASPHQGFAQVVEIGRKVSGDSGVKFLEEDLRPLHSEGLKVARQKMLYRQQYCGCIFSEWERFEKPLGAST